MEKEKLEWSRRAFLSTSVFGAMATGVVPVMAEWTPAEKANVQIVNDFCAAWVTRDMAKPLAFLDPNCVYRMTETTPVANGHEGVIQRLKSYVDASDQVSFDVLETFASGPLVMNHRIDKYISAARPLTWEGVGVFFVKDGKIKEWSDYTIRTSR